MHSVVVPIHNEAATVAELHVRLIKVMLQLQQPFELIFVNDGSTDNSATILDTLQPLTVITFRKNFGQTAALDAGIKLAKGDLVITLDGDLQNPPEEIPKLLDYLKLHNCDVVSGWRVNRKDSVMKKLMSRGAYWLRSFFLNDGIHDSGCTLKAYRRSCFQDVDLHGESHRFIPAILKLYGFSVGEVSVEHQPRLIGTTNYSHNRIIKGFVDIIGLWFWRNYSHRPLHLFGGMGVTLVMLGSLLLAILAVLRLVWGYPLSTSIWPLVAVLSIVAGLQLFITGLVAEVLTKTYYREGRTPYTVKSVVRHD